MLEEGINLNPSPSLKSNLIKEKIEAILTEINKPSRYIGQEIGSIQKNWEEQEIKTAIAFPDMYEVGISNLGHRILYHLINKNFFADRVYAVAPELKQKMAENNIPLYGVESFRALKDFDVIAFSLQYELSYPTILSMLDMANIPIKSNERHEYDPIIIAGGPGSYNPEPLANFIDVFIIGDGEDVLIEFLNKLKELKLAKKTKNEILTGLLSIEGLYIPKFYTNENTFKRPKPINSRAPEFIKKRISTLKIENHPVNFPVPYSPSVHDRAVIELRRGCGRMCRFCQPCFVNLPIRERSAEDVIELTDQLLANTGYEEYSLLSLSSNDYKNIEELVCRLNEKHAHRGASISLPSQRADSFSVELANLVQSVRKSTLTFAPEAGSQRLRNVINKNLNEEQILNAVLSAYKAGWTHAKLYFMIGLPTETFEDIEEIINLIKKIKNTSRDIKEEYGLKKHLDLNLTVSIFVPKPFTPFQWYAQDKIEVINEKISLLRQKIKYLKGVKLSIHDSFLCQLEAVFTRGDKRLNKLVELAWKKGSYLDAWDEHFNKQLWIEAANELNINFHDYSSNQIDLESELPWDIIDIGVEKNWLKNEYKKAMENATTAPCDEKCSNCGICKNTDIKKDIKSNLIEKRENYSDKVYFDKRINEQTCKYRLKIAKYGTLKYISHLDWQSLVYKAVRKAKLDIAFTQGFNPSPKISIGIALPLFVESICEYIDIELFENLPEEKLMEKLNEKLPENSQIFKIVKISKDEKSIDAAVEWAKYIARPVDNESIKKIDLKCIVNNILLQKNIFIEKLTKKGLKKIVDIKSSIYSLDLTENNQGCVLEFILKAGQGNSTNSNAVSLRADDFIKVLTPGFNWNIKRISVLDKDFKELL